MNLKKLHEEFIERANRQMTFGSLPISPREVETPIFATNRWQIEDGCLTKTFKFRREGDREIFVNNLFTYEREVQHNAVIMIDHDEVTLSLSTKNIDKVTELDKEYASFCDVMFKDVVYDVNHGSETQYLEDLDV
jgi:pterin-4a-carbinolamine dehydratase